MDNTGDQPGQDDQPTLGVAEAALTNQPGILDVADPGFPGVGDAEVSADVDDSASDVSMAAVTDDEPDHPSNLTQDADSAPVPATTLDTQQLTENAASRKRKSQYPDPDVADSSVQAEPATGQSKKVKLDTNHEPERRSTPGVSQDWSRLPPAVWHHIFTFCPPKTLGNLLRVNKSFHSYLDPSVTIQSDTPLPISSGSSRILQPLKPNAIWQASRRLFWPHMPTPLQGKTELEMWKLACALTCQHCGKLGDASASPNPDPLHLGPGPDGVVTVWPFATRTCGPCLQTKSIKVGRAFFAG